MSSIGFDSCFYDRLDQFSKSLNHVLLATKRNSSLAAEADWATTLELVKTLSTPATNFLAATSVAACLKGRPGATARWDVVAQALEKRALDQASMKSLFNLAWSLDEERAAVLMRMRQGHA
jgi:hypothetical protein